MTYTYEDDLSVTVGKPMPYKRSESAAGTDKYKHYVVFDVKIVNKTNKPWDPGLMSQSVQSDNAEGDQIYDSAKLPDEPQTKLLPGRGGQVQDRLRRRDPKDLVLEFSPPTSKATRCSTRADILGHPDRTIAGSHKRRGSRRTPWLRQRRPLERRRPSASRLAR